MKDTKKIKKEKFSLRSIVLMAILSAIAAVVMLFEIPVWFAPGFYEINLSEVIVLIGGFALGPLAAVIIEFLKVLINTLFNGTSTAFVGEAANFIIGCTFVLPAALIYRRIKTKKGALAALAAGTVSQVIFACIINYFILLPAYSFFYGMPVDAFIGQGAEKNSAVDSLVTLVLFATAPFNLLKGIVSSLIAFVIYKPLSKILHI